MTPPNSPRRPCPSDRSSGSRLAPLAGLVMTMVAVAAAATGVPPAVPKGVGPLPAGGPPPPSFEDSRPEPAADGFASLHAGNLAALVEGDPFILPTADGAGVMLRLDSQGQLPDGTRTFTFSGDPQLGSDLGASAAIAAKDGLVGGFVRPGGELLLELLPLGPGLQSMRWSGADLGCGGTLPGADDGEAQADDEGGVAGNCGDSPLFQDVLIVYNSAAASAAGGAAAIELAISSAIATANQSLRNSQLTNRIRPVRVQQVNFPATGGAGSQLSALVNGAAGAEIRALRDQWGADLVQLVSVFNDACGMANLFNGSAGSAFSVVSAGCLGGFTPIHEFGHSFGCCHAIGDGGGCNDAGYYPFSIGYRFVGASGVQRRTIMAYAPGEQIGYFSNPYLQFDGRPLGSLNPPSTNNARTIGLTASSISNFRCSIVGSPDCNENGIPDPVDLLDGSSVDCNVNLVPDECESGVDCTPDQLPFFPSDPDPRILDGFATSIDVGQRATAPDPSPYLGVGAFGDDASAGNSGAAFVWRLVGSVWTQEAKLKSPTPRANALFGWSLAAHRRAAQVAPLPVVAERSFLAVGAYRQPGGTDAAPLVDQGAVWVFARNDGNPPQWNPIRTIRPTDGLAGALFGYSVDMTRVNADSDDLLFTGAPNSGNRGAVFIHRIPTLDSAALPTARKLIFQFAAEGTDYGWCLTVDPLVIDPVNPNDAARRRAILAVGAPGFGEDAGRVKCHERTLTANALFNASGVTVGLPAAQSQLGERFGEAVALSDNLLAVGAPGRDQGRGAVFIFRRTALNAWNLVQSISLGSGSAPGDRFGASVSLQPEANGSVTLLVGAPQREVSTPGGIRVDAGAVYAYRMPAAATTFSFLRELTAFDARTGDQFGFSLLQRTAERWIGAPFNDDQGLNSGKAYLLPDPVTP